MDLDLEELLEEVLIGFNPKDGLVDDHEAYQLQHAVRRKMLHLDAMLLKESLEEIRCWNPKATLVEIGERNHFPRPWVRKHFTGGGPPPGNSLRWKKTILDKPQ